MKHVRVTLTANGREAEIHPMYDVVANADFVERATALQWNYTGDALGILHYVEGDREDFVAAMEAIPEVMGYELTPAGERSFYVYIRDATTESLRDLFGPMTEGGLVVVPPIRYREDGTVTFSLFGPTAELQAAIEAVPEVVSVDIEMVSGLAATAVAAEAALSERQRAAIRAALAVGYYEVPRSGSQADIAERLGCAPSTAAEHLRKAESTVVRSLFE